MGLVVPEPEGNVAPGTGVEAVGAGVGPVAALGDDNSLVLRDRSPVTPWSMEASGDPNPGAPAPRARPSGQRLGHRRLFADHRSGYATSVTARATAAQVQGVPSGVR